MRLRLINLVVGAAMLCGLDLAKAQSFDIQAAPANMARWMYPFNGSPSSRPTASTFAAFGNVPDFDTRDGQYLLGWNTTNAIPGGKGASNYLVRNAQVMLTISRDMAYAYSGKLRDYRTYFPADDPRHIAPESDLSPVELFAAGFRGGWNVGTFQQATTFFVSSTGGDYQNRTAFAACFNTNGVLVDVSNNVGDDGTNELAGPFEVAPFAVGRSTNVVEGGLMPDGSHIVFDLNLDDPLIYGYVQQALNIGRLRLVASSLVNANFFSGSPNYPDFHTIFDTLADPDEYPLLDIQGAVVRTDVDTDEDGLPDDWEQFYFDGLTYGVTDDPDHDGVSNLAEFHAGTNPNAAGSLPRISTFTQSQGAVEIRFPVAPNRGYAVEWSDDLKNWHPSANQALSYESSWLLKNVPSPSYPSPVNAVWRDTNSIQGQRFYRIATE